MNPLHDIKCATCGRQAVGCMRSRNFNYEYSSSVFGVPIDVVPAALTSWWGWCDVHDPDVAGFDEYWNGRKNGPTFKVLFRKFAREVWKASRRRFA